MPRRSWSWATSNRFTRSLDRMRALDSEIKEEQSEPTRTHLLRQIRLVQQRARLLLRALTAFYLSLGAFAAASLVALIGAVFSTGPEDIWRQITLGVTLCAGVTGVGGLVTGSAVLIWETRRALRTVMEETDYMLAQRPPD